MYASHTPAPSPTDTDGINQDIFDDGHRYTPVADLVRADCPFTLQQRIRHKRRGFTGTVLRLTPPKAKGRDWHVCMHMGFSRFAGPASSFEPAPEATSAGLTG